MANLRSASIKYKPRPQSVAKKKRITAYTTKKDSEMFFRKSIENLTRKIFICAREEAGLSKKEFTNILGVTSTGFVDNIEMAKPARWFFSPNTKEIYAQYLGITVAAIDAATSYASRLLHEKLDDLTVIEAIDGNCLLELARAMDEMQQKAWDSFFKDRIQKMLDDARDKLQYQESKPISKS